METLAHHIIEFYEKVSSWEHAVVKGTGLSPAQMHTIEIIGLEKSLRMKELAGKIGITTGTLTVMIDRLERQGYVRRTPHDTDRRSYLVVLTDKGKREFNIHHKLHLRLTEDIASVMTRAELEGFASSLAKIIKHI